MRNAPRLSSDFRTLWRAHTVSQFGVSFSNGATAYLAVSVLDASAFAVAILFGLARLIAAVISIPVGILVERARKRPVLVGTDVARSIATALIPIALFTDSLSLALLCGLLTVDMFLTIVRAAANAAHLRDLVEDDELTVAFSKFEATNWVLAALFTPVGGLFIVLFGPTVTLSVAALTYLVSAGLLRRIVKPESESTIVATSSIQEFAYEAMGGWRHIWRNRTLRALFLNAMLFGGSLMLISPLLAVLVLRDLDLEAWHYTFILGVPAVGGVLGTTFAKRVESKLGTNRAVLWLGSIRTFWSVWIALSPVGLAGFLFVLLLEVLLMFFAGLFNPTFSAFQVSITERHFLARTSAAWRASAMIVQPTFMVLGGALSSWWGMRPTIAFAGSLMIASSLLLPWPILSGSSRSGFSLLRSQTPRRTAPG